MAFVRCLKCTTIATAPEESTARVCYSCHTQNLERARAAEELRRVQREMKEREERFWQREEWRKNWGGAASDFSSNDPREDDEDDYQWNPMDDLGDEMNYSNYS